MKHSQIAAIAIAAANSAYFELKWPAGNYDRAADAFREGAQEILPDLYSYARERKFPQPETLARKACELKKVPFGGASFAEAPQHSQAFFVTFRAVAEALEPFHEADTPESLAARAATRAQFEADLEGQNHAPFADLINLVKRVDQLKDVTRVAATPGNADVDEYMRGMANGLILAVATMDDVEPQYIEASTPADPPLMTDPEKTMQDAEKPAADDAVDEVEAKSKIAQAETEQAIAESGGKLSADETKKKSK